MLIGLLFFPEKFSLLFFGSGIILAIFQSAMRPEIAPRAVAQGPERPVPAAEQAVYVGAET